MPPGSVIEENTEESGDTDDELEIYIEENESVPIKSIHNYRKFIPTSMRNRNVDKNTLPPKIYHCFDCGAVGHTAIICDKPSGKPFCGVCGKKGVTARTCGCPKALIHMSRYEQSKNGVNRPSTTTIAEMDVNNQSKS